MTKAHQETILALAAEQGIEATAEDGYTGKWAKGKKTDGVVVGSRGDIDTLTALFIPAAAKPARFTFDVANFGRGFIMF